MRKIKDDILAGKFAPISDKYSDDMHHMIGNTLNIDPIKRYNATQILNFVEKKLKEYKQIAIAKAVKRTKIA